MTKAGIFTGRMVLGVLVIVLLGSIAAQSEENLPPSAASDTNLPPVAPTNATLVGFSPANVDTNSAYGELVRLVRAGVDQNVILTYIENSLRFFSLDADRIIYLTDLGAPSEIIEAAMDHDQQLIQKGIAPAAAAPAQDIESVTNPPPDVSVDYFYDTLSPYGTWVYVEGYGRCWRPAVVVYNADWQPYCDSGRWVYTDCGWYWLSDYSWGWAAFHYGRWFRHDHYGWCWWPDTVWSPSWVCWRYDRTYCGWAPLPPYTAYRSGVGIVYRGSRVSVGFNFGLDSDCYTFVATRNLCDPMPQQHSVDRRDAKRIYDRTKVISAMDYDVRKKSLVNSGISPNIISTLSGQDITPVSVRHAGSRTGNSGRHEQLNRQTKSLVVSRPAPAAPQNRQSPARMHSGAQRTEPTQQRRTDVAPAGRNSQKQGYATPPQPAERVQSAKPSAARQPTPAPQSREQRSPAPSVDAAPQQPGNQRPAAPHPDNNRSSVSQGNRSNGAASGRAQEQHRNARPNEPPSGKSNGSAPGNGRSSKGQTDVVGGGQ